MQDLYKMSTLINLRLLMSVKRISEKFKTLFLRALTLAML